MGNRYQTMSDDELWELAKQRVKKTGCFKRTAIAAQRELWSRKHWVDEDTIIDDGVSDRSIEDIQYNG